VSTSDRQGIIEKKSPVSVKRQAELADVNRTSLYRVPRMIPIISDEELTLRRLIDRYHTDHPTWGYRTITSLLREEYALVVNRKKVRRLMREMGIYTIYPKPNLSKRYHAEHIRPYLLRKLEITKPDQVWGVDITYLHLRKGFMYLFVIIDWYSRCVVDHELSSTLDKGFVLACLKRAFAKSKPDIMNSDQGGHFTNPDYIQLLESEGVRISMDGKGQCLDNARTERFFRTLKYDTIYIHEVDSPRELRAMIGKFIHEYNTLRPHSSLQGKRPFEVYEGVSCRRVA
jgi:putative transposase